MNDRGVLFVLLVVLLIAHLTDSRCCHFEHLDQCDVFQKGGKSVCSRSIVSGSDVGNISEHAFLRTDVISESSVIELHDVEFSMWFPDACVLCVSDECPEVHDNCFEWDYHGKHFLFLNLSFSLSGWQNVTQVIFEITDTDLEQTTYHIIDVENLSGEATSLDKKDIYYTPINFLWKPDTHAILTMLPDESYMISAYLPGQSHNLMVDTITVRAPDCFKLVEEGLIDSFFCDTTRSISYWLSEVFVNELEDTVNVTFKVDTEIEKFPNYTVTLLDLEDDSVVQFVTLENGKEYRQFNLNDGYFVMNYVFNQIPVGSYFVTVQANVNSSICQNESYWGHNPCRIAYSRNFTIVISPSEEPPQEWTKKSDPTQNPHQPPTTPEVPPEKKKVPLIGKVVVILFVIIVCLLFTIIGFKCLKRIWEFGKGEDAGDLRTVHPEDSICGVVHNPLKTPVNMHNGQIQRLLDDIHWMRAETDTSAGDPPPSEVLSLDETTVTDGCEFGEYRQRQFLWKQPLLTPLEAQSTNSRQADVYHPLIQDMSSLDQNSNEIQNGVISRGQEPAGGS